MAVYFLQVKIFSRAKGSHATWAAAYRAGERIHDERTSQPYNFSHRQDVVDKEIVLPSQLAAFESSGFALVAQVLADSECSKVAGHFDTFTSDDAGIRALLELDWCRSLASMMRSHPETAPHLSSDSVAVQCTAFAKKPETNWLVSLHQDLSIPVCERVQNPECRGWSSKQGVLFVQPPVVVLESLVAIRVHIDACSAENGALRIVPGSYRLGRLSADAQAEFRNATGELVVPVERGGALLMRPLILHASSKAAVPNGRRVLHFLFGPRTLPLGLRWHTAI
ncbi:MAG: phytanoyl-CoA dioxygenase family protein [Gammaproteobacteria bacterium]